MTFRRPIAMFVSHVVTEGESFLLRELHALERQGQPVLLVRAEAMISGAIFRAIWRKPVTLLRLLGWILRNTWLRPVNLAKSLLIFPLAAELAERLPKAGIAHVHAHFATHATTMAFIVQKLAGIPYSFTAHAHAIFVERALLREKVRDAVFVRTISEFNRHFLETLYPQETAGKVHVVHVGATPPDEPGRGGGIVCVAAPRPHKGIPVLLEACEILGERCTIVRDADAEPALRTADIYVQPSVIAANGQMDGIPLALIDAMAAGKPVIASAISGIPELITDGESGLLVDPANPRMLAEAIARVQREPILRARLSARAREKVAREFSLEDCINRLIELFDAHNPKLDLRGNSTLPPAVAR